MNITEVKVIRSETHKRLELTEDHLRQLVRMASGEELPAQAKVFVEVPGGGDWSNMELEISTAPVIITWTEIVDSRDA